MLSMTKLKEDELIALSMIRVMERFLPYDWMVEIEYDPTREEWLPALKIPKNPLTAGSIGWDDYWDEDEEGNLSLKPASEFDVTYVNSLEKLMVFTDTQAELKINFRKLLHLGEVELAEWEPAWLPKIAADRINRSPNTIPPYGLLDTEVYNSFAVDVNGLPPFGELELETAQFALDVMKSIENQGVRWDFILDVDHISKNLNPDEWYFNLTIDVGSPFIGDCEAFVQVTPAKMGLLEEVVKLVKFLLPKGTNDATVAESVSVAYAYMDTIPNERNDFPVNRNNLLHLPAVVQEHLEPLMEMDRKRWNF